MINKVLDFFYVLWNHRKIIKHQEEELMKPFELRIKEMEVRNGDITGTFESPMFQFISKSIVDAYRSVEGAANYVAFTLAYEGELYELIIQRKAGKSPIEIVGNMQKEREELLLVLQNLLNKCPMSGDSMNERDAAHAVLEIHQPTPNQP